MLHRQAAALPKFTMWTDAEPTVCCTGKKVQVSMEYTRKIGPMPGQPGAGSGQPDRTMSFATVTSDSADPPNVRTLAASLTPGRHSLEAPSQKSA